MKVNKEMIEGLTEIQIVVGTLLLNLVLTLSATQGGRRTLKKWVREWFEVSSKDELAEHTSNMVAHNPPRISTYYSYRNQDDEGNNE